MNEFHLMKIKLSDWIRVMGSTSDSLGKATKPNTTRGQLLGVLNEDCNFLILTLIRNKVNAESGSRQSLEY